jgi:hypothetical protein
MTPKAIAKDAHSSYDTISHPILDVHHSLLHSRCAPFSITYIASINSNLTSPSTRFPPGVKNFGGHTTFRTVWIQNFGGHTTFRTVRIDFSMDSDELGGNRMNCKIRLRQNPLNFNKFHQISKPCFNLPKGRGDSIPCHEKAIIMHLFVIVVSMTCKVYHNNW